MFIIKKLIKLILLCVCLPSFSLTLNDNGGISATPVSLVIHVKSEADILSAMQQANKQHIPIAIMGKQHSQGGQTLFPKAIELNMLTFNKVLEINKQKKQVTVQSGNVLNITIRSVPKESNLLLSYSTQRTFAVVLYFDQNLSAEALKQVKLWTPDLIDAALSLNGNYYLPYQPYASKKQFEKAYPSYRTFLKLKRRLDPAALFKNKFYMHYLQP